MKRTNKLCVKCHSALQHIVHHYIGHHLPADDADIFQSYTFTLFLTIATEHACRHGPTIAFF
jgi:hypothetical protein